MKLTVNGAIKMPLKYFWKESKRAEAMAFAHLRLGDVTFDASKAQSIYHT